MAVIENEYTNDGPAAIFDELDSMRADSFAGSQRRAMALMDELVRMLRFLEPEELLQVANDRDLFEDECEDQSSLLDFILQIFIDDPKEGQKYCGLVEERIVDTAILGVDLYAVEMEPLEELASEYGVEPEHVFLAGGTWEGHAELVPAIRSKVREMVFSGNMPEFDNLELYPRR